MFNDTLKSKLLENESKSALREFRISLAKTDFSSNDYLGLAGNTNLSTLIREKSIQQNITNGATGSRLLTGHSQRVQTLEEKLAQLFKTENSLIFNSGYTANLAVLSSIPQKGDTILYDELSHACIKDGARLSLAKRYSFKHNDLEDLEKKIKIATGQVFIVIESIYSMDGDFCLLPEIVKIAKDTNAVIILDEAHSTGVLGENGSGLAHSLMVHKDIDIRIHTFGKAMGVHGACVCGTTALINYLTNFARPFIYTTALPPHSIVSIDCAFDYLKEHLYLQDQLHTHVEVFLERTLNLPFISKNKTCIQTALLPGNQTVKGASKTLAENGLDVRPILSPTVPLGRERLRICLHAFNTKEEILKLTDILGSLA